MIKFLITLMLLANFTFAIDYQSNSINVIGKAKVEIEPNKASFVLKISTLNKNLDSAIINTNSAIEKVNDVFKKYNLNKSSAKLKELNIREQYEWEKKTRVFQGFQVSRQYEVAFTQIDKLKDFLFDVQFTKLRQTFCKKRS